MRVLPEGDTKHLRIRINLRATFHREKRHAYNDLWLRLPLADIEAVVTDLGDVGVRRGWPPGFEVAAEAPKVAGAFPSSDSVSNVTADDVSLAVSVIPLMPDDEVTEVKFEAASEAAEAASLLLAWLVMLPTAVSMEASTREVLALLVFELLLALLLVLLAKFSTSAMSAVSAISRIVLKAVANFNYSTPLCCSLLLMY